MMTPDEREQAYDAAVEVLIAKYAHLEKAAEYAWRKRVEALGQEFEEELNELRAQAGLSPRPCPRPARPFCFG